VPAAFTGEEKVEVATVHGAYLKTLTLTGGLVLEDSQVALATLDTGKAFASSASGPLRFRVLEQGVASDWLPLATLVRLPVFHDLKCPDEKDQPCKLTGSNLFLVNSLSNDPQFDHPVQVPEGFPGYVLTVPRLTAGQLYVKLHDDPAVVNSVAFPAEDSPSPASPASPVPAAQTPNSPATGTQSSPSPAATVVPAATGQGAVSPPVSKPSPAGDTSPVPASNPPLPQEDPK